MLDIFGQETRLSDAQALESWNKCQLAFMAHGAATAEYLLKTLEAAPDFALGHASKGLFYMLLGRRELVVVAQDALAAAKKAALKGEPDIRETQFVAALEAWIQGMPTKALAAFGALLDRDIRDVFALKLDHATRFVMGDSKGMRSIIERALPVYDETHAGFGYLKGCYSFALEETGEYDLAKRYGHDALAMSNDDAWALHAVAHVHDMTSDAKGGLAWLDGRESAWAHCNNFRYHVWWHKALMHLELGQTDVVFDLYDQKIRFDKTDDYRDISNATSLLSRLELNGVSVGNRWEELANLCANRTEDGCLIFADLHYMLALVGDNRTQDIQNMLGRLNQDAQQNKTDIQKAMASPGLSAAQGLEAFGESDFKTAFLHLQSSHRNLQNAGGSHAQRDVFERLAIDSGIRGGFLDEVEVLLADRQAQRGGHEDNYALARRDLIRAGRLHNTSSQ